MTMMIQEELAVSLYFQEGSFFANRVQVNGYMQMQELLGKDCIAYQLPCDILLWHSNQATTHESHTLTIQKSTQLCHVFGGCLLTSNDEDGLDGFKALSNDQFQWLSQNHDLIESPFTGNYAIKFIIK